MVFKLFLNVAFVSLEIAAFSTFYFRLLAEISFKVTGLHVDPTEVSLDDFVTILIALATFLLALV